MKNISEALLGKYILSLNDISHKGIRINVISKFLQSDNSISKQGYRNYCKENSLISESHREYIREFLNFCGIKFSPVKRQSKIKIAKKLDEIHERNSQRINDYVLWCRHQRDYSQHTIELKHHQISEFFKYFNEFTQDNCRSFINTLESKKYSPASLNLYMTTLRQYGEYIKRPIKLKRIEVQRKLSTENVPSFKEFSSFLEALKQDGNWFLYWIVKILGATGMRKSELFQTTWADVISGEFYPRCKGKKHRIIYFPKSLVIEARTYVKEKEMNDNRVCFSDRANSLISDRGLDERMKRAASKYGFPLHKAHCHAFRHFFAKQYLAKSKDLIQLAELLGHSKVDTTRIYLQKTKEEQMKDINKNIDWI